MDTKITDLVAALLEAFLNNDSGTFNGSLRILDDGDQPEKGASVCQKIVDDQNMIVRSEELLGENHVVSTFVCERLYLGMVNFSVDIDALCLFRKNNRNMDCLLYTSDAADE